MKRSIFQPLVLALFLAITGCYDISDTNPNDLELWYKKPASVWIEALPVGNGRIGGMVFGGYNCEIIQLNEESVWAGSKINNNNPEALSRLSEIQQAIFKSEFKKALELSNKYLLGTPPRVRSYQPLGNLYINFNLEGEPESYRRSLTLNTGIAKTEYTINGNRIIQEVFVSAPHDVIVVSVNSQKTFSCDISLSRERDTINLPRDRRGSRRPVLTHFTNEYKNEDGIACFNGQIIDFDSPDKGPGGKHMRYSAAKKRLPPIKINSKGVIQEWIKDYDEPEPGHRHMSHLLGLYPMAQFTPETPDLFDAARATIERRLSFGGGHTGWSRAWIVNLFARLQDGEKAYENLLELLRKSTLTNLFDTHPPFQIDGNFGGTAGIAEMLIQSNNGKIRLLPAIPEVWKTGEVRGLCARGGFVVDVKWEGGKLTLVRVTSNAGSPVTMLYGDKIFKSETFKGEVIKFDGNLKRI